MHSRESDLRSRSSPQANAVKENFAKYLRDFRGSLKPIIHQSPASLRYLSHRCRRELPRESRAAAPASQDFASANPGGELSCVV